MVPKRVPLQVPWNLQIMEYWNIIISGKPTKMFLIFTIKVQY